MRLSVDVRVEAAGCLSDYAKIPIAFEVTAVLDVEAIDVTHPNLEACVRTVARPYVKDYDLLDGGPLSWKRRFDLSKWVLLGAYVDDERVGGAAVVVDPSNSTPELQANAAVLWDIRVSPRFRGCGAGTALMAAVERHAVIRGFQQLVVETQNVNVPACRFYLRLGFMLGAIHRFAYPTLPEEIQLLWHKVLAT